MRSLSKLRLSLAQHCIDSVYTFQIRHQILDPLLFFRDEIGVGLRLAPATTAGRQRAIQIVARALVLKTYYQFQLLLFLCKHDRRDTVIYVSNQWQSRTLLMLIQGAREKPTRKAGPDEIDIIERLNT